MTQEQQSITNQSVKGKLYHFMDYKKNKPFFRKPMKITIDDYNIDTYYMIKNFVYRDKQILVMQNDRDPNTIILVEAIIEDGQLSYISMLPESLLNDVRRLLQERI
ncbi:hypothetical protein [Bacillus rubiinfantis]|uniref:hypothetical protein n=1 Tax=Bacillus rubiinfantis TaxID=1499680 RepID=UPI0005A7E050|nr:hypothetical protein [Bacillus rubiinfantis]